MGGPRVLWSVAQSPARGWSLEVYSVTVLILLGIIINELDDVTEYIFGKFTYYTKLGGADAPDDVLPSRATWTGWGIDQRGIT